MADAFKAHVGPGGQGDDGENARQRRPVGGVGGGKGTLGKAAVQRRRQNADGHAAQQHQGQHDLRPPRRTAEQAHRRGHRQRGHGQQHFAHVYVKPGDLVM